MKILTKEEKDAHFQHIIAEGAKGLIFGGAISAALVLYCKHRVPSWKTWTPSIKAALGTIPTIGIAAFWADQGSWEFDKQMNHSEYDREVALEQQRAWAKLTPSERVFQTLSKYKYQVIVGAWAASLYGSWRYVNKDKYMSTTQKAVQARVYAQAITVVLLLSTILLAMKENEIKAKEEPKKPHWQQALEEERDMGILRDKMIQERQERDASLRGEKK